jgi:hypothetical protein
MGEGASLSEVSPGRHGKMHIRGMGMLIWAMPIGRLNAQ